MSCPNSNVESFPRDSPGTNGEMIKQENETDVHLKMEGEEASGVSACELGRISYKSEDGEQILGLPSELRMNDGHDLFESLSLVQSSSDFSSFASANISSEVVNTPCSRISVETSPLMNDESRDIKPCSSDYPMLPPGEAEDDSFTSELILKTEPITQYDNLSEGIKREPEEMEIVGGVMNDEEQDGNCIENPGAANKNIKEEPIEGSSVPTNWSDGFCIDKTTNGEISTSDSPRTWRHSLGLTEANSKTVSQNTVMKSHGVGRTQKDMKDRCDVDSGDLNNFNTPNPIHTGNNHLKCPLCPYVASKKYILICHLRIHGGEKLTKCSECDYATDRHEHLKLHMLTHTGKRRVKCSECDYATERHEHLQLHMLTHTGEKPFRCTECDFATVRISYLKRHMLHHTEKKPFRCTECDFATVRSYNLTQHMYHHTGDKPFKCSECNFATIYSSHLKRHLLTHSGVNLFKCWKCDFTTRYSQTLNFHECTYKGKKNFKCSDCGFATRRSSSFILHKRCHSGKKPSRARNVTMQLETL